MNTDSTLRQQILNRVMALHGGIGNFESSIRELGLMDRQSVLDVLGGLIVEDPNPEIRGNASTCLLKLAGASAVPQVLPLLDHPDQSLRWHVCGLLHDFGDERAVPNLAKVLLEDPEPKVRIVAAWALEKHGDLRALPALHHAADTDTGADWEGRTVADAARGAIERITTPPKPRWS